MEENYRLGTRYFEVDFSRSADGRWLGVHDWEQWQKLSDFAGELPPPASEVLSRKLGITRKNWAIQNRYSALSLGWLSEFLAKHPDAFVVTDMKKLDEFELFVADVLALENAHQFVFQAYSIPHVEHIRKISPKAKIILTLYRMGKRPAIYDTVAPHRNNLAGITLPMNWAYDPKFLESVKRTGLPLYLHGSPANINSRALHAYFAERGVSGFYLD